MPSCVSDDRSYPLEWRPSSSQKKKRMWKTRINQTSFCVSNGVSFPLEYRRYFAHAGKEKVVAVGVLGMGLALLSATYAL